MPQWLDVAMVDEFEPGSWRVVDNDNVSIIVFNIKDSFYAIQNVCTHDGGILAGGHLEGDEIVCPRHGAHFCVRDGAATQPPAYEDVTTYPTRVENGMVQVDCSD